MGAAVLSHSFEHDVRTIDNARPAGRRETIALYNATCV